MICYNIQASSSSSKDEGTPNICIIFTWFDSTDESIWPRSIWRRLSGESISRPSWGLSPGGGLLGRAGGSNVSYKQMNKNYNVPFQKQTNIIWKPDKNSQVNRKL